MSYDPLARPDVPAWLDVPGSPPGVISNLNAPATTGDRIIFMNLFTTSLMAVFVMMRMYSKYFLTKDVGWDDCKDLSLLCLTISRQSY